MLNYTNELALPNISGFTKHKGEEVRGGGRGVAERRSRLSWDDIVVGWDSENDRGEKKWGA